MVEIDPREDRCAYEKVLYKKQEGELIVSADGISFLSNAADQPPLVHIAWASVVKHQVSPASYPKALLKVIVQRQGTAVNLTFQFPDRSHLDRARQDIAHRLSRLRTGDSKNKINNALSSRKRSLSQTNVQMPACSTAFGGPLDPIALAVTRALLLAAHPTLKQQHLQLVVETGTVTEDDFWDTHQDAVQEEYARISGCSVAGTSSLLQSHLPLTSKGGRVTLGVEEMRQIFILYPAVHKAYEEQVPLTLADDQFWRKYLESEYFHRDRGRVGMAALNHSAAKESSQSSQKKETKSSGPSIEEQDARAAAVGADDFFSRYDQKLRQEQTVLAEEAAVGQDPETRGHRQWGRKLAVGQFDLASTFEQERSSLLEGPRDLFPPNPTDDGGKKGARVIQKYNRHWKMILHPEEAVAGANLTDVARRSVYQVLPDTTDAESGGGVDAEMRQLVNFAQATEEEANHAAGTGRKDYDPLRLKNVEAYYAGQMAKQNGNVKESIEDADKRYAVFSKAIAAKTQCLVKALALDGSIKTSLSSSCYPPEDLGRKLLTALTGKMAIDARTESESLEMVNALPEDLKTKLKAYFRRSSELLRHFFGLRRLEAQGRGSSDHSQKLARIVLGMETFYREMEGMRKGLPQSETGEIMRKMCLPIMDQLDWAFKLHRERSGGGGGGGFVAV
jgi:transcription initiation factor TFIIH subunit 1